MSKTFVVEVESTMTVTKFRSSDNFRHRKNGNIFRTLKDAEKAIKKYGSYRLNYRIVAGPYTNGSVH